MNKRYALTCGVVFAVAVLTHGGDGAYATRGEAQLNSGPGALPNAFPKGSPELGPVRSFQDPAVRERWIDARIDSLAAPMQDDPYAVIDECMAAEMEAYGAPGASIAIAVNGVITYTKGYGVRHPVEGGTIDSQTMFGIGSTTKMMTAAALMTLVEEGRLDLHAPVTAVAPELKLASPSDISAITPHHLLSQTSGLADTYVLPHTLDEFFTLELEAWATEGLARTAPNAPPGSFWNYANPNFSLAGYLLEHVTGQPYEQAIEERVWEPAGMPLTTLDMDAVKSHANYATGVYAGELYEPGTLAVGMLGPAGQAFSTPTELVTWALAMSGGANAALSAESVASMKSKHANLGYDPWEYYGYGIFVTDYHDVDEPSEAVTVFEHGGNIFGYGAQLFWVPERGLAFSILDSSFNSMGYTASCVLRELGGIAPPSALDVPPDTDSWDAIEGSYAVLSQVQWDSTSRVVRQGPLMYFEDGVTGSKVPLVNLFGRTFFIDANGDGSPDQETSMYDYTFVDNEAGQPVWMRNRLQVGQKVGQFDVSGYLSIQGQGCAGLAMRSAIDAADVDVYAAGVATQSRPMLDQPLTQDDPSDPTTAGWKHDFEVDRGSAYTFFVATAEPGDVLELYVLYDADRNGEFSYPGEVVERGYEGNPNQRALYLPGLVPEGDYQAWVHGVSVAEAGHTFDWGAEIVDGENLTVENAPQELVAGELYDMEICATGTEGLTGPLTGLVGLEYGSPPRRILTRVEWSAATGGGLFLPALRNERAGVPLEGATRLE